MCYLLLKGGLFLQLLDLHLVDFKLLFFHLGCVSLGSFLRVLLDLLNVQF